MDGLRDITVSTDGRSLAMTAGEYKAEIWMMENFLPPPPAQPVASRRPGAKR
jgi:hypothetical protein